MLFRSVRACVFGEIKVYECVGADKVRARYSKADTLLPDVCCFVFSKLLNYGSTSRPEESHQYNSHLNTSMHTIDCKCVFVCVCM